MSDGFFERWSRRKQQVKAGEVPDEPVVVTTVIAAPPAPAAVSVVEAEDLPSDLAPEHAGEAPESLTLADAQALTIDSDFRPFVARSVAPEVKNAAFKKLFADPHFNVMDRLDTYIDDYSIPSPLPESVLRQMASAKFLRLFDEEPDEANGAEVAGEAGEAEETLAGGGAPDVAQSQPFEEVPSPSVAARAQPASQDADDHHADLRLQPDDAARAEGARRGAG